MDNQLFNETIRNASAMNNAPQHKVFLFSLKKDSIVSPKNTLNYIDAYNSTGKVSSYIYLNGYY